MSDNKDQPCECEALREENQALRKSSNYWADLYTKALDREQEARRAVSHG